jgi:6-phosphogluconolactonase
VNFEVLRFITDDDLAVTVATAWLKEVESAKNRDSDFCVALSGGRIARKLFSVAAQQATASKQTLDAVQFFWADERCVPPDDAESNFHVAHELLLAPLRIPDKQIHQIVTVEPPEAAAAEAEAEIRRIAPLNSDGQPVLDLVLLGMGEDGHVASLFPGEPESMMTSPVVYRAVTAAKPPARRITMGYKAIQAARQVWVLASGQGKEAALRKSLRPGGLTPLARVLRFSTLTRIFTDIPIA